MCCCLNCTCVKKENANICRFAYMSEQSVSCCCFSLFIQLFQTAICYTKRNIISLKETLGCASTRFQRKSSNARNSRSMFALFNSMFVSCVSAQLVWHPKGLLFCFLSHLSEEGGNRSTTEISDKSSAIKQNSTNKNTNKKEICEIVSIHLHHSGLAKHLRWTKSSKFLNILNEVILENCIIYPSL